MSKDKNESAFPWCGDLNQTPFIDLGMTLRQYAAIKLKVPDSGTDWLDAMITERRRRDAAEKAMQLRFGKPGTSSDVLKHAVDCYEMADAMMEPRKS